MNTGTFNRWLQEYEATQGLQYRKEKSESGMQKAGRKAKKRERPKYKKERRKQQPFHQLTEKRQVSGPYI